MRIGIDARDRSLRRLLGGLLEVDNANEYHVFSDDAEGVGPVVRGRANAHLANASRIALRSVLRRLDVMHCAGAASAAVRAAKVVTIPDISFEFFPHDFPREDVNIRGRALRAACRRADLVFAGSALCRRQLQEAYGVPPDKTVVVPEAADHVGERAGFSRRPESLGLPPRYVFVSGGGLLKDNLPAVLEAFDRLVSRVRIPHYLVLAAPASRSAAAFDYALRLMTNRSRALVYRYLSESDLHVLVRAADLFVCAWLYDGPGLSPALAQWLEVPCLASNAGSFPEAYGDSVFYCDPSDPASVGASLERLLTEPLLRSELASRGAFRAHRQTWKRSAAIAFRAYQRLATVKAGARPEPAAIEA